MGGLLGQLVPPPGVTVTVAELDALPPAPVHDKLKVEVALIVPVDSDPLVSRLPDQVPEAVQAVAPVVLQVRVEDPAPEIDCGFAAILTVGGATGVEVCVAPPPPHAARTGSASAALTLHVPVRRAVFREWITIQRQCLHAGVLSTAGIE